MLFLQIDPALFLKIHPAYPSEFTAPRRAGLNR